MTSIEKADLEGDIRNLATLITVTTNMAINVQSMLWIARDLADRLKGTVRNLAGARL